jgi:[ribosomal protein S5]-alanine N-acetyltransferase
MQNNISTDRLFLDILTQRDYEFIIQLVNSKGWIEFIGNRNVHSKEEALAYINKIVDSQNMYYWVVRIKDGNIPIGVVSFLKREYLENFDIGFAFLPKFTSHGYAYEATKEILSMVSTNPEYDTVLATTIPNNINSIKLLIKLGLHFEKELEAGDERLHIYTNSNTTPTIDAAFQHN